jgi:hypothetical protein
MAKRSKADFMINVLAPDLRRSGQKLTARDVAKCGRMMKTGKKNAGYARWLKTVLIPDLRSSGQKHTAADLASCARSIGGRR